MAQIDDGLVPERLVAGGPGLDLFGCTYKAGAPSFAYLAKGGNHGRRHQVFAPAAGTRTAVQAAGQLGKPNGNGNSAPETKPEVGEPVAGD